MKRAKQFPEISPRNPLVVAAEFRKAGAHGKTEKARRRAENVLTGKLIERERD